MGKSGRLRLAAALAAAGLCQSAALARDLVDLDIEDLLAIKVYAVSKYPQSQRDAPAAVSVITADEIRTYGWRTLGDMLRAQRGMYLSYDRIYGYLGVRGILVSGDLNSRMIVTVDGHRLNDVVYEQAFMLNDFILDTDLIERVEVVRGPGSSLHGATPLFGVINIVTRDPQRAPRHEAAFEAGSFGSCGARYTHTRLFDDNASLMLSVSGLSTDGPDLRFAYPRFTGTTRQTDYEDVRRLFVKYSSARLNVMLAHAGREKGIATGATGALFDNRDNRYIDTQTAFNLAYTWTLDDALELEGRLFAGGYDFDGRLLYDNAPLTPAILTNRDLAQGEWQGTEWKLTHRGPAHTWVAGAEFQYNARQDQQNHFTTPGLPTLDDARNSHRYGLYFQDEWRYAAQAALTLGLRYDRDYREEGHFSPRLAWIWQPHENKTLKLVTSQAFRAPNVAEVYYAYDTRFLANPALKSEHIVTYEAVFEHQLSKASRYTINPYHFDLHDRISQVTTPGGGIQYQNTGDAAVTGIEFEASHQFGPDSRLRASYSRQRGRDDRGARLTDSPDDIVTLNYSRDLLGSRLRLGAELQYVGSRLTYLRRQTGSTRLLNLNLGGQLWPRGPEWSLGLYNALDCEYSTPDTPDPDASLNRDRIEQDGRAWRVRLVIPF